MSNEMQVHRAVFEAANDAFLIFEQDGTIVDANRAACLMYGYAKERLVGLTGKDIVHPDYLHLFGGFLSARPQDLDQTIESVDVRADGTAFEVEVRGAIISHNDQSQRLAVVRDVSGRKQAERLLAESEVKWDQALDFVDDAIYLIDPEDKLIRANKAFYLFTGLTPDEAIGRDITSIIHPQGESEPCPVCKARNARQDALIHMDADNPDNPAGRPIQVMVKMIRDGQGAVVNVLMGIRDLSSVEKLLKQGQIIDQSYEAVITTDLTGKITIWNKGAERLFGFSEKEMLGKGGEAILPQQVLDVVEENHCNDQAVNHETDCELAGKNGAPFFAHLSFSDLTNPAGKCVGIIYSVLDISERQKTRVAMGEQLCLLKLSSEVGMALTTGDDFKQVLQKCCQAIVDNLDAAFARIWIIDPADGYLGMQASAGMYVHTNGEHGRMEVSDATKIGAIALTGQAHLTNQVLGDPGVTDQEWAKREGMVAFSGHPLKVNEKVVGVLGLFARQPFSRVTLQSLTTVADEIALGIVRKKSESDLQHKTAEFEAIFLAQPDAVVFADSKRRIVMVNPALCKIFGYTAEELRGHYTEKLYASKEAYLEQGRKRYTPHAQPQTSIYEVEYRKKDGSTFPGETVGASVRDEFGNVLGYLCLMRDISAKKEAEQETGRLQSAVRQSQKMEAIGTLAGGVAHDFNNILTAIIGYTDLALYKIPKESELRSNLEHVSQAGTRAKELVKQILTFSRQSEQEQKPVEISLVIKEALKLLRASIPANIEIVKQIDCPESTIIADPTQMHQVIMNLCTNAYHAMQQTGGVLSVNLTRVNVDEADLMVRDMLIEPGEYILLEVSDTGPGVAAEVQERIFEPYFTTKAQGEGTGMGLAVVHGIVKGCGGEIVLKSREGEGSSFFVFFPAVQMFYEEEPASLGVIPTGNERILLVDEEEAIVGMMDQMLSELGYEVTPFVRAEEAAAAFSAAPEKFDLVITDMAMPKISGLELTKRLIAVRKDIPVILCTGFSELIDSYSAQRAGIREFMLKPLHINDVAATIRKIFD